MNYIKRFIYRMRGEVDTDTLIRLGLKIGSNFRRNEHCIIDQSHCWLISIGNDVTLAPNVHILAHDASMWSALGYTKIAPVEIGDNVFIGAGSIILPGVTIGSNVVIGAGSVVTKSIPANLVVAGNPAQQISTYEDFIAKNKQLMSNCPNYDKSYTLRNKDISDEQKAKMIEELSEFSMGFVE